MEIKNLILAIENINSAEGELNNGTLRCFLYGEYWYPIRKTMNKAIRIAGLNEKNTND